MSRLDAPGQLWFSVGVSVGRGGSHSGHPSPANLKGLQCERNASVW